MFCQSVDVRKCFFCSLKGFKVHKFIIFEQLTLRQSTPYCVFAWLSWLPKVKSSAANWDLATIPL